MTDDNKKERKRKTSSNKGERGGRLSPQCQLYEDENVSSVPASLIKPTSWRKADRSCSDDIDDTTSVQAPRSASFQHNQDYHHTCLSAPSYRFWHQSQQWKEALKSNFTKSRSFHFTVNSSGFLLHRGKCSLFFEMEMKSGSVTYTWQR